MLQLQTASNAAFEAKEQMLLHVSLASPPFRGEADEAAEVSKIRSTALEKQKPPRRSRIHCWYQSGRIDRCGHGDGVSVGNTQPETGGQSRVTLIESQ